MVGLECQTGDSANRSIPSLKGRFISSERLLAASYS